MHHGRKRALKQYQVLEKQKANVWTGNYSRLQYKWFPFDLNLCFKKISYLIQSRSCLIWPNRYLNNRQSTKVILTKISTCFSTTVFHRIIELLKIFSHTFKPMDNRKLQFKYFPVFQILKYSQVGQQVLYAELYDPILDHIKSRNRHEMQLTSFFTSDDVKHLHTRSTHWLF